MTKLKKISESNHEELLILLNPLLDYLIKHKYTYFVVVGKDGTCSRHMGGNYDDLHGIIKGMTETQPQVGEILKEIISENN